MADSLFSLEGRVALVTGASRGLGEAMAIALAEHGAKVALLARSSCSSGLDTIESKGGTAIAIEQDLSSTSSIKQALDVVETKLGPVDILVNNAGIIRRADLPDFSEADWDDVMDVNLKSLFLLSQAVAKRLLSAGRPGKIINIASMLSFQGGIRVPSYTASKSGVMGLTKAMANELAPHGINVNAIAPGYFATKNTQALQEDKERNKAILDRIPCGRWGEPADLAGSAVFLASRASDYMHGHTMAVDGGWLAR